MNIQEDPIQVLTMEIGIVLLCSDLTQYCTNILFF